MIEQWDIMLLLCLAKLNYPVTDWLDLKAGLVPGVSNGRDPKQQDEWS